jgi:hypothetical protein
MNTLFVLIAVIAVWLMTFVLGVVVAAQVKQFAAVVKVQAIAAAELIVEHFHAFVEVFFCLILPSISAAAGRMVTAVQIEIDGVVDLLTDELPSTSTYHLTVTSESTEYTAGEYLLRDNGVWRNVYLTVHARALMGNSADVIALSSAAVHDSNGVSRVWHLAVA